MQTSRAVGGQKQVSVLAFLSFISANMRIEQNGSRSWRGATWQTIRARGHKRGNAVC